MSGPPDSLIQAPAATPRALNRNAIPPKANAPALRMADEGRSDFMLVCPL
jgi:hypothetical protein